MRREHDISSFQDGAYTENQQSEDSAQSRGDDSWSVLGKLDMASDVWLYHAMSRKDPSFKGY